ncbi:hypothetical protein [Streptomyces sp. CB01373]|uniref:hypothetical protein n=1 Tax=Streptomyces sp. CB01373 TaxID=2020325 RepID=UPI00131C9670|nr:hypothetical protein [Streptomyces sp. CB01373]
MSRTMTFKVNLPFIGDRHLPNEAVVLAATAVWLMVVIVLAIIVLILSGWAPHVAVTTVGGAGLIAAKLRRDLA